MQRFKNTIEHSKNLSIGVGFWLKFNHGVGIVANVTPKPLGEGVITAITNLKKK